MIVLCSCENFVLELGPVLQQCHIIASEMVHFVQQVQYYINFEVLECSWDELLQKVTEAEDLDCIIKAHENFLDTVTARSFIDQNSTVSFGCSSKLSLFRY